MSRLHVKKEDQVYILTGKDRGKTGRVLRVFPVKEHVIVENINFVKRHTRANPQKNIKGGVVEKEGPVHISNVQVVCRSCGKHTRVGYERLQDGRKIRVCRKCKGSIDK
ncbi:MAG TPA: 50S ribosomal protein L24 [Acidobacteriota bacterium]|nr:50S ribosomal protein L24 [Acidobacteriota bacterium]